MLWMHLQGTMMYLDGDVEVINKLQKEFLKCGQRPERATISLRMLTALQKKITNIQIILISVYLEKPFEIRRKVNCIHIHL